MKFIDKNFYILSKKHNLKNKKIEKIHNKINLIKSAKFYKQARIQTPN